MNRTNRFRTLAVAGLTLAAVAVTATTALARPPHGGGGRILDHVERSLERMDLDATTRDAAFGVIDGARAEARADGEALHAAREQLRTLLAADAPDEAAVMAQAEAIGALETEASKARLRTLLSLRGVLPADVWAELQPSGERREAFARPRR